MQFTMFQGGFGYCLLYIVLANDMISTFHLLVRKGPFPVQSVESSHVGFYCTSDGHVRDYMVQAIRECDERCGQYMMVRSEKSRQIMLVLS